MNDIDDRTAKVITFLDNSRPFWRPESLREVAKHVRLLRNTAADAARYHRYHLEDIKEKARLARVAVELQEKVDQLTALYAESQLDLVEAENELDEVRSTWQRQTADFSDLATQYRRRINALQARLDLVVKVAEEDAE